MQTISVVIPSRLARMPGDMGGFHWVDRALVSIRAQTVYDHFAWQILIGLDKDQKVSGDFFKGDSYSVVEWVHSASTGQVAAVNAAAEKAIGDFLAFIEDDDFWHPQKIQSQLVFMNCTDLVTTNQRLVEPSGKVLCISEFPTPSTWFMRLSSWKRLGGFNPEFRIHVDTEWLGRFNQLRLRREHIVHEGVNRKDIRALQDVSSVITLGHNVPLVDRTVNPEGVYGRIEKDDQAKAQSKREYDIMLERFGKAPW